MSGWTEFLVGAVLFFGFHIATEFPLREKITGVIGENVWKIAFSVVTFGGIWLMASGYREAPYEPVFYYPDPSLQWVSFALMAAGFVFLVGAYATQDMQRVTRHPMLWGVAIWGIAHLLANGTAPDVALFGGFTVYSFLAMALSDAKKARRSPQDFAAVRAGTSVIPFLAMAQGRAGKATGDLLTKAVLLGLVFYAAAIVVHAYVLRVAVAPAIP